MALGRQIALLAALAAALLALAGCGGDDSSSADIPADVAENINSKLDRIQERAGAGNCTGDNSAEDALDSLREDVPIVLEGEDEQFVSDLEEMLTELDDQIAEQCEEAEEPETTTTSTTTEETTIPDTTETTTTDTEDTSTTTTDDTETTPEPPDNGGGPTPPAGGGTPGGGEPPNGVPPGQSGGFTPGDRATPGKAKGHDKHKHEPKDRKK